MSAMATSLMGPLLVDSALAAAPVPRPPQPTRATWIRSLPAAWTEGMATLARADAAARRPVFCNNSRREETGRLASLIGRAPILEGPCPAVGSAGPQGGRRGNQVGSPDATISDTWNVWPRMPFCQEGRPQIHIVASLASRLVEADRRN